MTTLLLATNPKRVEASVAHTSRIFHLQDTIPNQTEPPPAPTADTLEVQGVVTDDSTNAPLANVLVKYNDTDSALTDQDGKYRINAGAIGILTFVRDGYDVKEEPINSRAEINIDLASLASIQTREAATASTDTSDNVQMTDSISQPTQTQDSLAVADNQADTASSAQGEITGTVRDDNGPVPGVSVTVKGKEGGVTTDENGNFSISAPGNSILRFSSLGYNPTEEFIDNRNAINVTLQEEAQALEEVEVVAIGYGTMDRSKLTSSVSSIGADQIENEVLPSVTQAIQGRAGGVQVTQRSGSPGGGLNIRVRGTTSINASSDPLYVVDGIPVNSTTNFTGGSDFNFGGGTQGINILSSINPSDVQSVEVLKDAASSAIYGARAANGVVLITTKKGQPGTSTFNFNMYEGFSEVPNNRRYNMMNTEQYHDYMRDFYRFNLDGDGNPTPVPDPILANPGINTDWQGAMFRSAPTRNYELSASGGSEKTQYFTSIGYMRQAGVLLNSDFSRISARLNLDHQHSEKLRFTANVNLTRAINDRVQEENSSNGPTKFGIVAPPNIPVFNADGSYGLDEVSTARENPIAMLQLPVNNAQTNRILATLSAEYRIIPELALKTNFGTDMSFIDETMFMPPTGIRAFEAQRGIGARRNSRDQLWINETTLNFDKAFGDHNLNALLGVSVQESRFEFVHANRSNFPSNDIEHINAGGIISGADAYPEEWAIASGFARVDYGYKGRYLLTANFRADGSSRFGANNRWGYFPSFAAAWRASDEEFFQDISAISNLKLRASWGITGNQNIGNYASYSLYTGGNNYMGLPGFVPNVLGDRNLKWETTKQLDIGLDLGLFNNRISLLADYYVKNTSDLLLGIPIPFSSGFQTRFTNAGEIQNKGFEFELTTQNLVGEFKWNTTLNMTFNRNTVRSLANNLDRMLGGVGELNMAVPGEPLGVFFGWKMIGVNPETGLIDFEDQNGNPTAPTNPNDRQIIGDPNPDFFGGITNTFQYKNFDLSIMGQFSYGNDIFNYNLSTVLGGSNISANQSEDLTRRWRNPGDITDIPRPTPNDLNHTAISDRFVEDGSFFRLRNITLGYTFPSEFSERLNINSLRVYATVQNAFVFTKYRGYDPEVSSQHVGAGNEGLIYGYDYGSYPQPRIFTAGVNLMF
ncbi:SusC/RagA family TonB-linked outer membrane protein [Olivibacter sp. SDN3]|nr:SusC/RagA family TonB-linked outer membrane protein [Olivibacter sp. SDN3]